MNLLINSIKFLYESYQGVSLLVHYDQIRIEELLVSSFQPYTSIRF